MNLASHLKHALVHGAFYILALSASANQTLVLDGAASGKRFDGIGAVSGGGATGAELWFEALATSAVRADSTYPLKIHSENKCTI